MLWMTFPEPDSGRSWPMFDEEQLQQALAAVGLSDPRLLAECQGACGGDKRRWSAILGGLTLLRVAVEHTANPQVARVRLARFVQAMDDPAGWLLSLAQDPRLAETLVVLFAGSQFLGDILVSHPEYLASLRDPKALAQPLSADQLRADAVAAVADGDSLPERLDALRRWQRRELLRIGACDLAGLLDLSRVTEQLSCLAEALVSACLGLAAAETRTDARGLTVIALGKLGGGELNYSSDIDLLFLARADAEGYRRLAEALIDGLTRVTGEGFLYRVDMRLRPWGQVGPLVCSVPAYLRYFRDHACLWEKQALLKARPIAGDLELGSEVLASVKAASAPLLREVDRQAARAEVRQMKERIEAKLRSTSREWGEVKLGKGSIRDVEFVTQYLQLAHAHRHPDILSSNTLEALLHLFTCGLLSADEYRVLVDGYTFLRPIEHYLQIMHYQQTHALPSDLDDIVYLARRLGFQGEGSEAGNRFLARYEAHSRAIRRVYRRYLEEEEMMCPANPPPPQEEPGIRRHVARMAPSYAATFCPEEIERHARLAEGLDEDHLVQVDAAPLAAPMEAGGWRVTVVGYDYPGELSLICGLLFVYNLDIRDGEVFTYEPLQGSVRNGARPDLRQKIVDVFTVYPTAGRVEADIWERYARDLGALLRQVQAGQRREAQAALAARVALAMGEAQRGTEVLPPIDIEIDNESSDRYTVLSIHAPDTIGFLYEFTNALALNDAYIARVTVDSAGSRVQDTLYLTDAHGNKITDPRRQRELRAASVLVKHFTHLLPHSPNPEAALLHFREFLGQLFLRPDWPDELTSLERPEVLTALARLLGVSEFLWDDFLRMQYASLFPVVRDVDALARPRSREELRAELTAALAGAGDAEARRETLNAIKDRETFRVDMRHIQGHVTEFGQYAAELSDVAEVVVEAAVRLCYEELAAQFGAPLLEDRRPCPMSVCALGKLGGRELGYASDIELLFLYAGNGETTGPRVTSTAEFHDRLVQSFLRTIYAKREGIFEIDLRLRPYGEAGSLAVSLASFRRYFAPDGPAWAYERQALTRLRPVAGDETFGKAIVASRDELVYNGTSFDVAAMRAMRERQLRHLVTAGTINAKFSAGALVDVEYLVQALQMEHGHRDVALRATNTQEAMRALAGAGILLPEDYRRLREAHVFMRHLIDALRMVRGNARDLTVPPVSSSEFEFLARRLGYGGQPQRLYADLGDHLVCVQELGRRLLDNRQGGTG